VPDASEARIALVAHSVHDHGGMERSFLELLRSADGRFRVTIVAGELDLPPELRRKVEWRRVPIPRRPIPLRFAIFFVLGALRLARARADLVHTMGAIVPNRADLASVHFCHAAFRRASTRSFRTTTRLRRLNSLLSTGLALAAERWCYRLGRVKALAVVSTGVGGEVRRYYPGVPVVVTPNGVDSERYRPDRAVREEVRRAEGVQPEEIVALFVGGDWARKGLAVTIAALAQAAGKSPSPLRLWVVGAGDEARYSQLADEHGFGERVRFMGPRADAERFFQAADVFVLASDYETFSIAAYEAAAAALPIVSTRVSGVDELVGADEAGMVVERDAPSIAAAVARLAADSELRSRMGRAGRERVQAFTWERSAESVLALYEELLVPSAQGEERV
jgi:UDP-glucose:(heptosyl)LPS alpha-1,3-glucosyltransferase